SGVDETTASAVKKDLDDLLFFENLNAHSLDYLREDPSLERLVETLQRIEETLSDTVEKSVAPMGVTIRLGAPIDARALPENLKGEAFTSLLRGEMQSLIDAQMTQGPAGEWGWPPRASRGTALAPPGHEDGKLQTWPTTETAS